MASTITTSTQTDPVVQGEGGELGAVIPPTTTACATASATTTAATTTTTTEEGQEEATTGSPPSEYPPVEAVTITRRDGQKLIRLGSLQTFATVCLYEGEIKFHVRRYSSPEDNQSDDYRPTKQGIALSPGEFGDLIQYANALVEWAAELRDLKPADPHPSKVSSSSGGHPSPLASTYQPHLHQHYHQGHPRSYWVQHTYPYYSLPPPAHQNHCSAHRYRPYPRSVLNSTTTRPAPTHAAAAAPAVGFGGRGGYCGHAPHTPHHLYAATSAAPCLPPEPPCSSNSLMGEGGEDPQNNHDCWSRWKEEGETSPYWDSPQLPPSPPPSPPHLSSTPINSPCTPASTTTNNNKKRRKTQAAAAAAGSTVDQAATATTTTPTAGPSGLGGGAGIDKGNKKEETTTGTLSSTTTTMTTGGDQTTAEQRQAPTPPVVAVVGGDPPCSNPKRKKKE